VALPPPDELPLPLPPPPVDPPGCGDAQPTAQVASTEREQANTVATVEIDDEAGGWRMDPPNLNVR
jgi:hypothetical protein